MNKLEEDIISIFLEDDHTDRLPNEKVLSQLLKLFNETVLSVIGEEEEGKPFYWKEDHEEKIVLFARNMLRNEQHQKLKEIIGGKKT